MSFIGDVNKGAGYTPGFFLANNEDCTRETREIPQENAPFTTANGAKYWRGGSIYYKDGTAEGIIYEDVDVTNGDMPGSVVTRGEVYDDRVLMPEVSAPVRAALVSAGIRFVGNAPKITRPNWT